MAKYRVRVYEYHIYEKIVDEDSEERAYENASFNYPQWPKIGVEWCDTTINEIGTDSAALECPQCQSDDISENPSAEWMRCNTCAYEGPRREFGYTDAPQPPAAGQGGGE